MRTLALAIVALAAVSGSVSAQADPFDGAFTLSAQEMVYEKSRPSMTLTLKTVEQYPCSNFFLTTRRQWRADTLAITLVGRAPEEMCDDTMGPARTRIPIPLAPGEYVLAVTRKRSTDRLKLVVTSTRLVVHPIGKLTFVQPDTSVFLRPPARSFLLSCLRANHPALCDDFANWLVSQPGIDSLPLAPNDSIGFPRYDDPRSSSYKMFRYADERALARVRRCMRYVADTVAQAVGVSVYLQTVDGEVMRAWSGRSLDERHIPTPQRVSNSRACPASH